MQGKKLRKPPGFHVFVSVNDDKSLTKEAKLFRDILRFCTINIFGVYFRSRELTRWLLSNNSEFIDDYSGYYDGRTRTSYRIENRLERVTKCLDSLIEMELLEHRSTKSTKGNSTTSEYALNDLGWLIGLFLESFDSFESPESSKKSELYEKIFKIFEQHFSYEPSSMDKFCLVYFKNLKEHGLFEEHIDNIKQFFFLPDLDWHDALKYLMCLPLSSDESGRKRWKIWKQSLDQLPQFIKGLFLYQLKLYFDRMMERHVKSFQRYELERLAVASLEKLKQIVIELECKKCMLYYTASVDILAYLDWLYLNTEIEFYKYDESEKLVEWQRHCEKCNTKLELYKIII